jgi:polyisoprenoid-binding protein YceI
MAVTKWVLDPTHSDIEFKVKHLMISTVKGQFNQFEGTVETEDEDFSTAKVHFSADIDSISTNNEQRDGHLKNTDFFDVENHPKLTFESEQLEKIDDGDYRLHGTITLRGVSKRITLNVEFSGVIQDPWGLRRAGASVTGKLNRTDFGVSFGAAVTETGGILLGDEVKIAASVEFVKQAEQATA